MMNNLVLKTYDVSLFSTVSLISSFFSSFYMSICMVGEGEGLYHHCKVQNSISSLGKLTGTSDFEKLIR